MPESDRVYLTFDDGPTPGVTEWILDQLAEYDAKATFFCLGKNAEQYPHLYRMIVDAGHAIGNHTYSPICSVRPMRGSSRRRRTASANVTTS